MHRYFAGQLHEDINSPAFTRDGTSMTSSTLLAYLEIVVVAYSSRSTKPSLRVSFQQSLVPRTIVLIQRRCPRVSETLVVSRDQVSCLDAARAILCPSHLSKPFDELMVSCPHYQGRPTMFSADQVAVQHGRPARMWWFETRCLNAPLIDA